MSCGLFRGQQRFDGGGGQLKITRKKSIMLLTKNCTTFN